MSPDKDLGERSRAHGLLFHLTFSEHSVDLDLGPSYQQMTKVIVSKESIFSRMLLQSLQNL